MSVAPVATADPLLVVRDLHKEFPVTGSHGRSEKNSKINAVGGMSFELSPGETLGIVGESGCGKTTIARMLMGLETPSSGSAHLDGVSLFGGGSRPRSLRPLMQMVFQDPYTSLNPRMTAYQLVSEPWAIHRGIVARRNWNQRAAELLELVGISPDSMNMLPRSFSGGQRQRIGLARALALEPRLLVLDEPVTALDVSIQAQILDLLSDIQQRLGTAMILIAHDLAVVRNLAHRVAVMYLGRFVEVGIVDEVYEAPHHPYTRALLSAVPRSRTADRPTRIVLVGEVPSPIDPPSGCTFRTRCWKSEAICAGERPALERRNTPHPVACFFPENEGS